jgi:hypothetical protein
VDKNMMTSKLLKAAVTILLLSAFCITARADDSYDLGASGADPVTFDKWINSLRTALKKHDKAAVAKMIESPLSVNYGGDYDDYTGKWPKGYSRTFTQSTFLRNYDKIFTHDLQKKIINSKKSDFWDKSSGVCFAQGIMWVNPETKNVYKIESINFSIIPPDTDAIAQKIKDAEKSTPTDSAKIASLYSTLGRGYDTNWRVLGSARESEQPEVKKNEEAAYRKAISLRQGTAAKSEDQAKDLRELAKLISIDKNRTAEALQLYEQAYALQKTILPPNSLPLRKAAQDISGCKKALAGSKQAKK